MNTVQLTGNLCRDLQLGKTESGKSYLENTIGVTRDNKNAEGIYESDFINFVAYDSRADYLSRYAKKGDKIEICGRIRRDSWQSKDGSHKEKTYIVADKIQILTVRQKERDF